MTTIAVSIIDPSGRLWAQLLDNGRLVREVIFMLVERMKMPDELNYQLTPAATGQPLKENITLRQAGVRAGAELELKPVHDRLLKILLDELYGQAKDYVKDQLWELAKKKLGEIYRLDPNYPDPSRLKEAVNAIFPGWSESVAGGQRPPMRARQQSPTRPRSSSNVTCCLVGALVAGGVAIVGVVALVIIAALGIFIVQPPLTGPTSPSPTDVTLGTGDVQITLRWYSDADLDLHVLDPNGDHIWFENRYVNSGGQLDVDANADCIEFMANPVENVFWPTGGAPYGYYQVYVEYFKECYDSGPTDYEVTIRLNGQVVEVLTGTLYQQEENSQVYEFGY